MVAFSRIIELRKPFCVLAPIELAAVDDNPADRGTVTANPFGSRVHHDICPMVNWPAEVSASTEGIVHHHRHALLMRHGHNSLEIWDIIPWVAYALEIHSFRLVIDQAIELLCFVSLDEFGRDTETRVEHFQLVVGAAVQVGRRDYVVAGVCQGGEDHELGGLTGGSGNSGNTTFQCCDALFEDVNGGLPVVGSECASRWKPRDKYVHDSAVDVAKLFEAEQASTVGAVVEDIALENAQ